MHSFADATRSTLTSLAAYWLILFAVAGALDLVLDGSVEMAGVRQPLLLAWFAAAVALLAARFAPARVRVPALLGIAVALAAGTVVGRELTGLVAPWVQITMLGGMLLVAVGFIGGPRPLLPASVLVVALVLAPQRIDEMVRDGSPVQIGVPFMEAMLIVGLGLLAALIRAVLLSSAAEADETSRQADAERADAVREQAAAEAVTQQMALLHDTALNTLDAIALGSSQHVDRQRRRCIDDARRLAEVEPGRQPLTSLDAVGRRLTMRAEALGLSLTVEVDDDPSAPPLPAPVAAALTGALEEALLNVDKHAGVREASAVLRQHGQSVSASVRDQGRGFDVAVRGVGSGLPYSVTQRMRAVGGDAVVTSEPGSGTSVLVRWQAGAIDPAAASGPISAVVRRLMVSLLLATMLFTTVVVLAEWEAFERPWVTLGAGLLLGAWGLLMTSVLQRERWLPTPLAVVTVALACLAPFWTVAADQYCSSSFGGVGWVDARIPLIVLVMLTSRFWWRWLVAAPLFVAATWLAGSLAGDVFAGCDSWAITAVLFAIAIFLSALMAGRTLSRLSAAVVTAHEAQQQAEENRVRAETTRLQQQRWFEPAVASCVPLLTSIGSGALEPADPHVRSRCRSEAGYLRGLVTVARAPDGVRDELRQLLQRAHTDGVDIVVRGDLSQLPTPDAGLQPVLDRCLPPTLVGATTVEVTGWGIEQHGTVMLRLPGAGAPRGSASDLTPDDGWTVDVDDSEGLWIEVSWTGARATPTGEPSRSASPTRTPARSGA